MSKRIGVVGFLGLLSASAWSINFTATEFIRQGSATELLGVWEVPGRGAFTPYRQFSTGLLYLNSYSLPPGASTFGSHGRVYNTQHNQLYGRFTASNSTMGAGYLFAYLSGNQPHSTVTLTDPDGPLVALPDSVSVAFDGTTHSLFEVRPASGPRKVFVHRYKPGVFNSHQAFALPEGARILDCDLQVGGGLVFLAGTPEQASTYVVSSNGIISGPFAVGAASQILWSESGGGKVFTAGASPAGMFFTSGPLDAPYTQAISEPMPFLNTAFEFTAGSINAKGTIWWGGKYTSALGDQNGFISGLQTVGGLAPISTQVAGVQAFDEQVYDVATTGHGISMWTGTGAIGLFNTETGEAIQGYPVVPNGNMEYRAVATLPAVYDRVADSEYVVIGYDRVQMRSWRVVVDLRGDLHEAIRSAPTVIGGLPIKVYGRLYDNLNGATHSVTYSAPEATGPDLMFFANNHLGLAQLQTIPVHEPVEVTVTLGDGFPKEVKTTFTILPPTPRFFTPASQTVRGGTTIVTRLTLTGKAPSGGLSVDLSTNGAELQVASSFVVPEGLWSRSFVIRTSPVASTVTRSVTATYGGIAQSTSITLTP